MKKFLALIALTVISSSFAADYCSTSCDKDYSAGALACYKMKEVCMQYGPVGTEGMDFCFENYQSCVEKISDKKELCVQQCRSTIGN